MRKLIKNKKGKRSILMKNMGVGATNSGYGTTITDLPSSEIFLTTQVLAWLIEDKIKDNNGKYSFKSLNEVIVNGVEGNDWWILVKNSASPGMAGYRPLELGRGDPPFNTEVDDKYFIVIQGGGTLSELYAKSYIRAFYIKWGYKDFIFQFKLPDTTNVNLKILSWDYFA